MNRKTVARRAAETRWLYRQESSALKFNKFAFAERSMGYLRRLAQRIWKKEAPKGRRFPEIRAGRGCPSSTTLTSYCLGFTEIELARHHRNVLVLIHELTHALGPCVHGPRFVSLYFRLLHRYAGYNRWFLQFVAAERNIVI